MYFSQKCFTDTEPEPQRASSGWEKLPRRQEPRKKPRDEPGYIALVLPLNDSSLKKKRFVASLKPQETSQKPQETSQNNIRISEC